MRSASTRTLAWSATALLLATTTVGVVAHLQAQATTAYLSPPRAIVDILDAPPPPGAVVSPARNHLMLLERRSMPTIRELASPMLRLGGTRINARNYAPHRSTNIIALSLVALAGGASPVRTALAPNTTALPIGFSHDGREFAYGLVAEDRVTLWTISVPGGVAREVTAAPLNATFGQPCEWMPESTHLVCAFAVDHPARPPAAPEVPAGPNVQENAGKATPAPTYQDLLESAHDEDLFEYYFTRQLAFVNAVTGTRTAFGPPGLYDDLHVSPNGAHVLVTRYERPFSRTVPYPAFTREIQLWPVGGAPVKTLARLPVADDVPIAGVPTGARRAIWNEAAPATVVWVEALDGGDTRKPAAERDRILALDSPFAGEPRELARTAFRFTSIVWTEQGTALLSEYDRDTRVTRTWVLSDGTSASRKLWERSADDVYGDPGVPVRRPGHDVVLQRGDSIYLRGEGASPEGARPFLRRLNLQTFATEDVFRTAPGGYEPVVALLDDEARTVLTRHESRTAPPNYVVRRLAGSERQVVTTYRDPAPQLQGMDKQRLIYTRKDGVQLTATLYLPPGHKPGDKHPVLLWAYPREFGDTATAGQVRGSLDRFTVPTGASHLLLLTEGYAILDDPAMPIVGAGDTANDTYVEQLVASAEAAVDKVVEMGVAERHRIGVGGHSYGAFMAANLLAHADVFRAGIARSGAYNRTLTPFGFQNERRTFWEVPDIYAKMSPFWNAHRIKEPILLIHGEADDNTGTYPIQSERLYAALKGHGATVRYVTLPLEAHGYAARESVLHTVAEMLNWMDKYVKHATPNSAPSEAARP